MRCAGCHTVTRAHASMINAWENSILRRMLGSKRKASETFVEHIQRATRIVRGLKWRWGYECLFTRFLRCYYAIAGSCADAITAPQQDSI